MELGVGKDIGEDVGVGANWFNAALGAGAGAGADVGVGAGDKPGNNDEPISGVVIVVVLVGDIF